MADNADYGDYLCEQAPWNNLQGRCKEPCIW